MTTQRTTRQATAGQREMTADNTLVVPVEVAALAVNDQTRITDGSFIWQRWQADFATLAWDNLPPEPVPFTFEDWSDDPGRCGVYLQWQLPEALTRGRHDEVEGIGDFPLVPNRWLVVRYRADTRQTRAWVVQSDYLGTRADGQHVVPGTVSYLDPDGNGSGDNDDGELKATFLGRRYELSAEQPWREPADARAPFLTAIGSGLLTFTAFQPYNENVFSLHDPLDDVAGDARLSYHVSGWYSDPTTDILASDEPLARLLERLEWLAPAATGATGRTLYTGSALGVLWQPGGGVPASDCPGPDNIAVCVANSSAEALAALPGQSDGEGALSADEARLFGAFALGTLDALDRSDGAGDDLTARAAHATGFGPASAGFTWRVVDGDTPEARAALTAAQRAERREREERVVADLNQAQAEHDALARDLAAAQERLYLLWALSLEARPHPDFAAAIDNELNPAVPHGAAGRVTELTRSLEEKRAQIPWGTTPAELEASAAAHAAREGMRSAGILKRVPAEPFEDSTDPVVLLQGANLNAPLTRGSALPCRPADRLVTAIGAVNAGSVVTDVARIATGGLPAVVPAALTEFFILARTPDLGTVKPEQVTGALPAYGTEAWRQPWQPLYLMWKASYTPLAYEENGQARWRFDGTRYRWTGQGEIPEPVEVMGRQILTPSAGHALAGQIDNYTAYRADLPQELTRRLREDARKQDFLSQTLDGFGATLRQRETRAGRRPPQAVELLTGPIDSPAPVPGTPPKYGGQPWKDSVFHELRAGQLAFTRLSVVDRFGRAVNLVQDELHFEPVRPGSMTPDHPIDELAPDRLVELGPRLLQPARLRLDFLAGDRDEDVAVTPGANPVCAWLLHNRLDRTLACFDPEGVALGELREVLSPDGRRVVDWVALPGSSVTELARLEAVSPHAYRFLAAIRQRGPAVLAAVRATLDDSLSMIDPDGPEDTGLGFLLGRPLALVRTRLDLELCGPARRTVGWTEVIDPPEPHLPGYQWFVRLGEPAHTDDGLVGCVLDDDYDHFETVIAPRGDHGGYLRRIPTDSEPPVRLSFGGQPALATLLVDPRVPVHATTDILPTGTVHVPQEFTARALARMTVGFRAGPLLAAEAAGTAVMPAPATVTGTWAWAEPHGTGWRTLPITVPDPAALPLGRPEIRSGFLLLGDAATAATAADHDHQNGPAA
ncbi:hypothetical protein ACFRAR_04635 [Kitasatospora sp. NPDC056651]|uniref:hypothetical protein n=1 Tax=Kitasatospora sp. NPDC056651 TaxID=3345892 RepID=UPI00367EB59C